MKKDPGLPEGAFRRSDESPDERFYATPRLVTHIDDRAIAAVTRLYRELFPADGIILDLMSSWVSHLPTEIEYKRVVGLGMNERELQSNPRLDDYVVRNLNENPRLPFENGEFDGVGICVSVDYLTRPVEVLREVGRVLRPGAPVVITFSNECFSIDEYSVSPNAPFSTMLPPASTSTRSLSLRYISALSVPLARWLSHSVEALSIIWRVLSR